jgi:hypothetical protein
MYREGMLKHQLTELDVLKSNVLALLSGGHSVAQLLKALPYKLMVSLVLFIDVILPAAIRP